MPVMLDHAVRVFVLARNASQLVLYVRAEMHTGTVPPDEPGFAGRMLAIDEIERSRDGLVVHRFHALLRQRTGVLDLAVGRGPDDTAWPELLPERRAIGRDHVTGIVRVFRLLLGIQVVEIAEELVETVVRGQVLVTIAEVVLAKLPGGVTAGLEQGRNRRVFFLEPERGTGQTDFRQAGTEHALPGNERRAAGCAGLLAVVVGERHAFVCDAVDIRRLVTDQPERVGADVALANIIAPDDQDVGPLAGVSRLATCRGRTGRRGRRPGRLATGPGRFFLAAAGDQPGTHQQCGERFDSIDLAKHHVFPSIFVPSARATARRS